LACGNTLVCWEDKLGVEPRGLSWKNALWLLGPAVLAAATASACGQDGSNASPYTLKTTVREVVLDVVVVDAQGKPVDGLKQSDFSVYESGTMQRIRSFQPPAAHTMPAPGKVVVRSTADLQKIGNAPVTMLVLDELNTSFEDMAYARNRMEKFLNAQGEVLQQPTILLAAGNAQFEVIHDFTQDRAELLTALHKHMPDFPWKMQRSGTDSSGAFERMSQSLNSLLQIAQATSGTVGRKTVIWVGKGFPGVDLVKLDNPTAEIELQNAMKQITDQLLKSRVTLFTIDPESQLTNHAIISTTDDLDEFESRSDGQPYKDEIKFSTLAPATGGTALFSRNDIDAELAQGVEQGSHYYTLVYSPMDRAADPDVYRQIRVKVTDPSMHVITRDGYFAMPEKSAAEAMEAKPQKEQKQDLESEMSKAALGSIAYNGLNVMLQPSGSNFMLKVPAGELRWVDVPGGKTQAEITVMLVAFSAKGKAVAHLSKELSAQVVGKIQNPEQKAAFAIPGLDVANAKRYKVVVRDAQTGKIGTAEWTPQ